MTVRGLDIACERVARTVADYAGRDFPREDLIDVVFKIFIESVPSSSSLDWRQRGPKIEERIEKAYQKVRAHHPILNAWTFNGSNRYVLCGIDAHRLFTQIIKDRSHQTSFSIWDPGCGDGRFGDDLGNALEEMQGLGVEKGIESKIKIVSCRGEQSDRPEVSYPKKGGLWGRCRLTNFSEFKLENLSDEFELLLIPKNFDLIAARFTLQHLVDPVGTLAQCIDALREEGILMSHGFYFLDEGEESLEKEVANQRLIYLLRSLNYPFLVQYAGDGLHPLHSFVIQKTNSSPCALPMQYEEVVYREQYAGYSIASKCVTRFKISRNIRPKIANVHPGNYLFGNKSSKPLFEWLKRNNLVKAEVQWKPINFTPATDESALQGVGGS